MKVYSDPFTPPSWIHVERFRDIDLQAARYQGYGQAYQQLSRGAFEGRVVSFDFGGDLLVNRESANQVIAVAASTPTNRLGLCMLTDASPHCTFNGAVLTQDHLLVCPKGNDFVGKIPAGVDMYCLDLSLDLLPEETDDGWKGVDVIYDPNGAHDLRGVLKPGLSALLQMQSAEQYSAATRALKSSLADALWRIVTRCPQDADCTAPQCAPARTLRLLRCAQEYIDRHLTGGISVGEVCRHTGASRRGLERIFLSVLGMGPAAFIRNLQLNRVRRDLLSRDQDGVSIGDIAAHYGVWHWSRFSQNYQRLFGELPSQTRAHRVPAPASARPVSRHSRLR